MKLDDYLYSEKMTATEFARKLNVSRHYISRIKNRHNKPSGQLALSIYKETQGKVTLDDLFRD